jgi:hypothetical protein
MNAPTTITREVFVKRLVNLCLRGELAGLPKDETDRHILLKSARMLLGGPGTYTEKEINDRLQGWVDQVCSGPGVDRVSLRRYLVDYGYLARSSDGARYQVGSGDPVPFEPEVDQVDVVETVRAAKEEKECKKREYLNRK